MGTVVMLSWLAIRVMLATMATGLLSSEPAGSTSEDLYSPDNLPPAYLGGPSMKAIRLDQPLADNGRLAHLPVHLRNYINRLEMYRGMVLPPIKRNPRVRGRNVRYHRCYHNPVACF